MRSHQYGPLFAMAFEIHNGLTNITQTNVTNPSELTRKNSSYSKIYMAGSTLLKYILLEEMKKQPIKSTQLQTKTVDLKSFVDVYIRNNRKQALLVHISPKTQIEQLNNAVAKCFAIPQHQQVLMFKGKQLRDLLNCKLENKSIIHVIDRRNITPLLTVKLKKPQSDVIQFYSVSSNQLIGDFIKNVLKCKQPQKPLLIYAGRRLKSKRSFGEQMVQNESQVLCLYKKVEQNNLEMVQRRQKNMQCKPSRHNQQPVHFKQCHFGLEDYLPKIINQVGKQTQIQSPEPIINLKQYSSKENNVKTTTTEHAKDFITSVPLKQTYAATSEPNLRKIQCKRSNSSQSLMMGFKQKNSQQERQNWSSQQIEGSNISQITARQHSKDCRNEETCIFQCVLKGLINETLPVEQKQQINQLNWSEGELMKIAAQLQKWQERIKIAKTTSKEADSSLQAVQLPLIHQVRNTARLNQTSYFSSIQPRKSEINGQSPTNQHHLLFHKKEQKVEDLKDLIMKVENSSLKTHKTNSLQTEVIVQMESMSSEKKQYHPQSTILIDVSFGQDHGVVSSTLSKNQKLSQHNEQLQVLQNVQIKKQFYSTKGFQSYTNMLETEIRVSPGQQKIAQKQFVFRSQPFYFQPLQFYISMFQSELTHQQNSV